MANIYNSDVTNGLSKTAKIQQARDKIPNQLAEKIVPTMETNPNLLRKTDFIFQTARTSTGTLSVMTAPTDKDTYITGAEIGVVKDVANDCGTQALSLRVVRDGQNINFIGVPVLTLTAQSIVNSMSFPNPIKVDRGSTIVSTTLTVGAGSALLYGGVTGYYEED